MNGTTCQRSNVALLMEMPEIQMLDRTMAVEPAGKALKLAVLVADSVLNEDRLALRQTSQAELALVDLLSPGNGKVALDILESLNGQPRQNMCRSLRSQVDIRVSIV